VVAAGKRVPIVPVYRRARIRAADLGQRVPVFRRARIRAADLGKRLPGAPKSQSERPISEWRPRDQ